jgi:hypothetical protein
MAGLQIETQQKSYFFLLFFFISVNDFENFYFELLPPGDPAKHQLTLVFVRSTRQ